jgi:dTDP-glucose 4,6-dehydratase
VILVILLSSRPSHSMLPYPIATATERHYCRAGCLGTEFWLHDRIFLLWPLAPQHYSDDLGLLASRMLEIDKGHIMRVLVTGGAGFIGSALSRHLVLEQGWQVAAADKLTYAGHRSSLASIATSNNFTFAQIDICERAALDSLLVTYAPDAIVHLAAETHVDRSIDQPMRFVETNVLGTAVLLEATRAYWATLVDRRKAEFRFLHISTDEIYGSLGATGMFTEVAPTDPRSPYSASKASADHLVSAWHHTYGIPALTSNCSNNFGPFQLPEKLIPLTILNAYESCELPIYGDGLFVRDWLFVDDHVRAMVTILKGGRIGQRYNVGGRNERTNLATVNAICDLVDLYAGQANRRALIRFVADRPGHDRRYAIDPSKLEAELGWRPQESFESALAKTVKWYIENSDWWRPLRDAGHGRTRLGLVDGCAKTVRSTP